MSDQQCYNLHPWNSFYQRYLNQHAIMSQYIQHLTQNTSTVTSCNVSHTCHCGSYCSVNAPCRPASQECCSSSKTGISSSSSEYELEEEESYESDEDDTESEYEYELNVDAFIAMRAAKKALDENENSENKSSGSTSESNSIVLIDSDKEEFEFIDFGGYNAPSLKLSHSVGGYFNKKEEVEAQKQIMSYLYGEKSSTIGGLETAMAVNFESLCDIHQPSLWPVLPVRL